MTREEREDAAVKEIREVKDALAAEAAQPPAVAYLLDRVKRCRHVRVSSSISRLPHGLFDVRVKCNDCGMVASSDRVLIFADGREVAEA